MALEGPHVSAIAREPRGPRGPADPGPRAAAQRTFGWPRRFRRAAVLASAPGLVTCWVPRAGPDVLMARLGLLHFGLPAWAKVSHTAPPLPG